MSVFVVSYPLSSAGARSGWHTDVGHARLMWRQTANSSLAQPGICLIAKDIYETKVLKAWQTIETTYLILQRDC